MPERDVPAPTPETAPDAAEPLLTVDSAALTAGGRGPVARRAMVLALQRSVGNAAVSQLLREVAPPVANQAPEATPAGSLPLIVGPEAAAPGPSQMRQAEFLDEVQRAATATAAEALAGTVFTAAGCPWIEHWVDYYRVRSAAELEQALHRYAPATVSAAAAQDCVALICERVRDGIRAWRESGEIPPVPAEGPGTPPGVAGAAPTVSGGVVARSVDELPGRLGPGRALDPSLRRRMDVAFGADFSGVQVHTDPAAGRMAAGAGARAFAYGSHLAFAPAAYEPGTAMGEALIAHELAHVVQQGEAAAPLSSARSAQDPEQEASAAALAAVRGDRARPRLTHRVARSLQACPDVPRRPRAGERRTGQDAADAINAYEIQVVSDRTVERAPVGFYGKYHVEANVDVVGRAPGPDVESDSIAVGPWYCHQPHGMRSQIARWNPGSEPALEYPFDSAGDWIVTARVGLPDGSWLDIDHDQRIVPLDSVADAAFAQVAEPADAIRQRAALELQVVQAGRGAVRDQDFGTGAFISLDGSGRNPIRPQRPYGRHRYTFHADPNGERVQPARYLWYAVPESDDPFPSGYGGHRVTEYKGRFAFELGEGTSASFHIERPDVYDIVCEPTDDRDRAIGPAVAHYRQAVLTAEEQAEVDRLETAVTDQASHLSVIAEHKEVGLRATFTSSETGQTTELALFVGPARAGVGFRLADLTPGVTRSEYTGFGLILAVDDFEEANTYPPGMIVLEGAGVPRRQISTDGESLLREASSNFGWASLGLAAVGVVSLFTPAVVIAPYLFAASAASGATAGALSIADELRNNEPNKLAIAIDVVGIAASVLSAGRAVAQGARTVTMSSGARFAIYAQVGADVVQGVLISIDAGIKIDKILEEVRAGRLTREEATDQIVRLLAMLAVQGGLMAYGARDLRGAQSRIGAAIGRDEVTRKLQPDVLHNLDALDDAAIASLNGLRVDELEAVSRVVATNREGARRLSRAHGADFVARARQGGYESLEQLADDLGRTAGRRGHPSPADVSGPSAHPEAEPPASQRRTEQGDVDVTGRPDDALALEHPMAPDAHGEPHVLHMTEAGTIYRCSNQCRDIVADMDARLQGIRERAARSQRALDLERNWRREGSSITAAARKLRAAARKHALDHQRRLRTIARSRSESRARRLEESRRQWLEDAESKLMGRAEALHQRMARLEDAIGLVPTPSAPARTASSLDDLRGRYDDILRSDETLRRELDDIERARTNPDLERDVRRRTTSLEERLIQAVEARIPEQIALARQLQGEAGTGLITVTVGGRPQAKCRAAAGSIQTVSGAHVVEGYAQHTRDVLAHDIGHTFAPDNFDERVAGVLNRGRPPAERVPVAGTARASHAEKQAALAAPGQPIGVSLPMCFDCYEFFIKHARASGRPVVVADPDVVRVFYPDGRVLAPSQSGTRPLGGAQP